MICESHSKYWGLSAGASTLRAMIGTGVVTICSDMHAFNIPNGSGGSEPIVTSGWFSMAIGIEKGVEIFQVVPKVAQSSGHSYSKLYMSYLRLHLRS
jgi:hypothetical protein